ncbi:Protoheme IX farnesyltransferase [Streptomyces sp. PTY087I2]|nr:Protoheme IX farnesyltransferase [Streptomyces sp. PTY087I2]
MGSGTGPGVRSDTGSGAGPGISSGTGPGAPRQRLRAWAELLRVSALFSVPGDALAGAAAVGRRPGRGTALAVGASLCLYEAGMALNDWADRDEDAVDRPHRPIPSGRISPAAALGAAGVLTAAGLALAARAGRPALTVATGLAATVWAYDLHLKHTKAGPAAMAAARSLDLLLGATATATTTVTAGSAPGGSSARDNVAGASAAARAIPAPGTPKSSPTALPGLPALPAALVLGAHTYGVTAVSRHETQGGSTGTPLAVLATTTALAAAVLGEWRGRSPGVGTALRPGAASGGGVPGRAAARPEARLARATDPGASAAPAAGLASPLGRTVSASTRLLTSALGAPPRRGATSGSGLPARATDPGASPGLTAGPASPLGRTVADPTRLLTSALGAPPRRGATSRSGLPGWAADPTRLPAPAPGVPPRPGATAGNGLPGWADPTRLLTLALTTAYLRTAGPPLLHAALNPSPPLTQRAVGGGIRAMIPLQAALAARAGSPVTGLAVMGLVPLARSLARKVSLT